MTTNIADIMVAVGAGRQGLAWVFVCHGACTLLVRYYPTTLYASYSRLRPMARQSPVRLASYAMRPCRHADPQVRTSSVVNMQAARTSATPLSAAQAARARLAALSQKSKQSQQPASESSPWGQEGTSGDLSTPLVSPAARDGGTPRAVAPAPSSTLDKMALVNALPALSHCATMPASVMRDSERERDTTNTGGQRGKRDGQGRGRSRDGANSSRSHSITT